MSEKPYEDGINICFSADRNYLKALSAAIASILTNGSTDNHNIYILHNSLTQKDQLNLNKLQQIKEFYLEFIHINPYDFKDCPVKEKTDHITVETYYRLKIPSLFPDVDKILYLDGDIVVLESLKELWSTDVNDYYFAGVEDNKARASLRRLNLKNQYINAGVMLINIKKWRADNIMVKLFDFVSDNSDKIQWWDQDVINSVLQENVLLLDDKWNYQYTDPSPSDDLTHPEYYIKPHPHPYIIHYSGSEKPWFSRSKVLYRRKWCKYNAMTPYKLDFFHDLFSFYKKGDKQVIVFCGFKINLSSKKAAPNTTLSQ